MLVPVNACGSGGGGVRELPVGLWPAWPALPTAPGRGGLQGHNEGDG